MAQGWPLDVSNLITYFDDPAAGDAWVAQNVHLSATEHSKELSVSAYSAMFQKMGTGAFAAIFFEESLPALAKAYNPRIAVVIPRLMERGDPVSEFRFTLTE